MFSPSPALTNSAQPGVLARIFGALSPQGASAYNQAQLNGSGKAQSVLAGLGQGALGALSGQGILGQILGGAARGARRNG